MTTPLDPPPTDPSPTRGQPEPAPPSWAPRSIDARRLAQALPRALEPDFQPTLIDRSGTPPGGGGSRSAHTAPPTPVARHPSGDGRESDTPPTAPVETLALITARLIGVRGPSEAIARHAAASEPPRGEATAGTVDRDGGAHLVAMVTEVLRSAMAWHRDAAERPGVYGDADPHFAHRQRLIRELARWQPPEAVVLALRFLADFGVDRVAELTGRTPAGIREITRHWSAEDDDGPDLLHSLGRWTAADAGRADISVTPLAHLDLDHREPSATSAPSRLA